MPHAHRRSRFVDRILLIVTALSVVVIVATIGAFLSPTHAAEIPARPSVTDKKAPARPAAKKKVARAAKPAATPVPTPVPAPAPAQVKPPAATVTRAEAAVAIDKPVAESSPSVTPVAAATEAVSSKPVTASAPAPEHVVTSATFMTSERQIRVRAPTQETFATPPTAAASGWRHPGGESYVAGFFGVNLASGSSVNLTEAPQAGTPVGGAGGTLAPGTTETDPSLAKSLVYGAKLGHYFERLPWLGVEVEAYNTNPNEKPDVRTRNEPGFCPCTPFAHTGTLTRVFATTLNVLARYPGERFQPYIGVGLGIFNARRTGANPFNGTAAESQSSTQPGLNTELGLRYRATEQVGLFAEWKYNRARFNFDETANLPGRDLTYQAHMLIFGVFFSFN